MIRVTVELLPNGHEEDAVPMGVLEIANRSAVGNDCDYDFRIRRPDVWTPWLLLRAHRRADGVWVLIQRALRELPVAELSGSRG